MALTRIELAVLAGLWTLTGCALYEAVTGFFESGDEAAQAAQATAEQAEDTLKAIEHAALVVVGYLAAKVDRPIWRKLGQGAKKCANLMKRKRYGVQSPKNRS